jgi:hypothetical protein
MGRFDFYSFKFTLFTLLEQQGLALSESLNVVSVVPNALNAIKMRCCKEKMHSVLSENAGYYQVLKIPAVF